jgi:indolepyruvate ferredoxin oxidoreductase, beta subunit
VTADRTTLITSTHRVYTIAEKSGLQDDRVDDAVLLSSARESARRLIAYDMAEIAASNRSVISAVILGGIAGSGTLPFAHESYREAIRHAGISVEQSLAAFDASAKAAADTSVNGANRRVAQVSANGMMNFRAAHPRVQQLLQRVRDEFPPPVTAVLVAGLRRLIDYQDIYYASSYLDRLAPLCKLDTAARGYRLSEALARGLALWMSFEDTIRVADLKTRGERVKRIRDEVQAAPAHVMQVTEFMKPRVEEICGTLPVSLGQFAGRSPRLRHALSRFTRDRQISTSTLTGFLLLRAVAGLRRWRRGTLRFADEHARIEAWLNDIAAVQTSNYDLAMEMAECQQLVKGYGDTHARGLRSFERLMTAAKANAGMPGAAEDLRRWRAAALQDEEGVALEQELAIPTPPASVALSR